MKGLVGVAAGKHSRYSSFSECIARLERPPGWGIKFATGYDAAANRTALARETLKRNCEYLLFVDDDMVFAEDHLIAMLSRAVAGDIKVLASLYYNRTPPYYAMAFNKHGYHDDGSEYWVPVSLEGAPSDGVAPVVAAGTGGMLIHRDVLLAIEDGAWFDHGRVSEDLAFCAKVIEAGFEIYLDLEARMGHTSIHEVWPQVDDGFWHVGLKLSEKEIARFKLAP